MTVEEAAKLLCLTRTESGAWSMVHPGMPMGWQVVVATAVLGIIVGAMVRTPPGPSRERFLPLGGPSRLLAGTPWLLVALRIAVVVAFCLVIAAGLMGTPLAERNLATTVTWTLWWTLVIISVFFLGTAWCAVCPWDTLASLLVKGRPWRRAADPLSLEMKVPKALRSLWPALLLFVGLTWLELGVGVTSDPRATAMLALVMVVLAVTALAVFQRKAFCRYFCPVGRTVGCYSQLAPVELRPVDPDLCARCTTLECYHGTETVEPCPTHLTMGRFAQNTYCTSCGACAVSCPEHNVAWRLRSMAAEARAGARPHWDEAWFMLGLLTLTSFHGITMLPGWEEGLRALARLIGDSGRLLASFSLGMAASMALPIALFAGAVEVTRRLGAGGVGYRRLFSSLAFAVLPIAFAYHVSHNLNHLAREGVGLGQVLANPLGQGTLPLSRSEIVTRYMDMLIPEPLLHGLQAALVVWGLWVAVEIVRHRGRGMLADGGDLAGWRLLPMLLFLAGMTVLNLGLLAQDMVMRL